MTCLMDFDKAIQVTLMTHSIINVKCTLPQECFFTVMSLVNQNSKFVGRLIYSFIKNTAVNNAKINDSQ